MATTSDAAAGIRARQTRRALPIIPAIPHKLSRPQRAARPITPDENPGETVNKQDARATTPQPIGNGSNRRNAPDPLTPDTQVSGAQHESVENRLPASSEATSAGATAVEVPDAQEMNLGADTTAGAQSTKQEQVSRQDTVNGASAGAAISDQLPAAFYPADQRRVSINGHDANQQAHPFTTPLHVQQPGVDGIVFGATNASPAVPVTPQDIEQDMHNHFQPTHRQPPGLMHPEFASQFYPGHAHHHSRSQAPWIPPAATAASLDPPYINGRGLQPPQFNVQTPFDAHLVPSFSPGGAPATASHAATPRSQSPLKPLYQGTQPPSEHEDDRGFAPYHAGPGMQSFVPPKLDMPFELLAYLNSQLGNPKYADAVLRVRSPTTTLLELPVHSLIVARSPAIAFSIERGRAETTRNDHSLVQLDVFTQDKYITSEAVDEAIRILYGAPLFTVEGYCYGLAPFFLGDEEGPNSREALKRMAGAISYAATGKLFGLRNMHSRGLELIRALLRWDTVELALEYGLRESIYSRSRDEIAQGARSPVEFDATNFVERDCVDFLAYDLSPSFNFFSVAPEMQNCPRLPHVVESKQASHNPRLSGIRFGDVPPEDLNPDLITRTLSTILLSLPIALLDGLFKRPVVVNQLGWPRIEKLMHEVVTEREDRRRKVLHSWFRQVPDKSSSVPQHIVDNLFHEEQANGRMLTERRQTH
ncbi:hypothetical protein BU24DRAFT_121633 [Aaosphaeria arxii CBS 175.79]|uniref:Uncharacterized protein n=1 Tax=Aaosphaeria arxii CBS 175.79 TaxID=1450172 RepID=A0A6A5Y3D0_9PLEO|nr:uncharacterized protein BU24DRAFT_121633 [Aaosphaeria arxii CBS 175.79]KAF2019537.1 hypothetical protein BU24DRAFT_121633 [Aaosphaeria arxii CBS 175.79]